MIFLGRLALLLALGGIGAAQSAPVVNAHLTTGVARLGSEVSLVVDVEGAQAATLGDLPAVDGLRFGPVGQPGVSIFERIEGRNRMRTYKLTFVVPIVPAHTGNFTIPSFSVNAGGRDLPTPELALKIVDDLKGEELGYFQIDAPKEIVEGQPFTLDLRFGYDAALGEIGERVNYVNLSLPWLDQLPGLLELDTPASSQNVGYVNGVVLNSRGTTKAERIPKVTADGRTFLVMRIHKRYLATRAGKLEFPTSHLEFGQVESQGFFSMGPSEKHTYFKRVPAFSIDVLELPEQGRPLDFTGAVGTLSASATVDRRDVDAGDSIKVTVEWAGEGNLEFFDPPDPSRMDAFKSFRLYGTNDRKTPDRRVVTYDLAPITADTQSIPSIPLVVFDPSKKAYVTIPTEPIPIRVRALKNASGLSAETSRSNEPGIDIRDIQTQPGPTTDSTRPGDGAVAAAILGVPILWLGVRTAVRRRGDPDAPAARARRAARKALRRDLASARTASGEARALETFLGARTGEPAAAWVGRDPVAWAESAAASAPAGEVRGLSVEAARALAALMARLDESAWARGDEPLPAAEIERTAEALLRGGL